MARALLITRPPSSCLTPPMRACFDVAMRGDEAPLMYALRADYRMRDPLSADRGAAAQI